MEDDRTLGDRRMFCHLLHSVAIFADPKYQQAVWLRGEGTEVSTYSEEMVGVLNMSEELYEEELAIEMGFTFSQFETLVAFRDVLRHFEDRVRGGLGDGNDAPIIADSEWPVVVHSAAQATAACSKWRETMCVPELWLDGDGS